MSLSQTILWAGILLILPPLLLWRGLRGSGRDAARAPLALALGLAALLPLGSFGLYLHLSGQSADTPPPSLQTMVQQIEARLVAQPDDAKLWQLAARHYLGLGEYRKAADAFARQETLQPGNPDALTGRAEALSLLDAESHAEEIRRLVDQALRLDPQHMDALWLSLLGAIRQGNFEVFHARLQQLRTLGKDDPVWQQRLEALRQLRNSAEQSGTGEEK